MRIVIDMQGAQTESRFRGIGRYSLEFTKAIVRNRGDHEILIALNGSFPEVIELVRATFDGLLPQENIRVWHVPGPVKEEEIGNACRRETAELVREAFLGSMQPDIIHITSLFEGYLDDAVTSIGLFDNQTPVSVSLYDLIPLLNPKQYLQPNPRYAAYYNRKIQLLKQAALLLSISAYTRQEGLDCLGGDPERIVNVSTAIGPEFKPLVVDEDNALTLRRKIGLTRPFVLYTGGCDERKNLPRLIHAWSELPGTLRQAHQLVIAGDIPDGKITELSCLARSKGLRADDLLFSGYVSDVELVNLYNLCKLFIFPSWHEGFGLPVLEAMACGAPVIASNATSLPEVVGLQDALFDPFSSVAISNKMVKALEDESFRAQLCQHASIQVAKFSWDHTAVRAIAEWKTLFQRRSINILTGKKLGDLGRRPRLAFVSPMPPERTGIADYSKQLLPVLSEYYEIELVVAQFNLETSSTEFSGRLHDVAWLRANAQSIDRVVYQFGNSPFHSHMVALLEEIPGTVVLHDFFLSGLMAWQELHAGFGGVWTSSLYVSHGYSAVRDRFRDTELAKRTYPANWQILQNARGLIVHSEYSRSLLRDWYADSAPSALSVIPLLRAHHPHIDKIVARKQLGIRESDFVVCSFGFLDGSKLNHRLLNAWASSELVHDKHCRLIFVGENHAGEYGADLLNTIRSIGVENRINITGFISTEAFGLHLAAADLAVQLRTDSRGETSAAVLDCMSYALPVIVNANGAMAELDSDAVWILPDDFIDADLVEALETLRFNPELRQTQGSLAQAIIRKRHDPKACAKQYATAIEDFHRRPWDVTSALVEAIVEQTSFRTDDVSLKQLASSIASNFPSAKPAKRLFLDVTATCSNDLKTGIERVARSIVSALLESPPNGYRIEPVYLSSAGGVWHHRYARGYTLALLGCPSHVLPDEPIDPQHGDYMLGLDISGEALVEAECSGVFSSYRALGMNVQWIVYDLLPIRMPHVFPSGADRNHARWLQSISRLDGAICISKAVADDLAAWRAETNLVEKNCRPYCIQWWHLGATIGDSVPSKGLPKNAVAILDVLRSRPSFLMVGTIEPRKGYLQTIEAFTKLWADGLEWSLVIVGKEGWSNLSDDMRRDIPQTVECLRSHPELGKKLFWLEGISDEFLEQVYAACECLIAASYGEGFGLPLIEAAKHNLKIIARDIPIFREVVGDYASYFDATTSNQLSIQLKRLYVTMHEKKEVPMRTTTWKESAQRLIGKLFNTAKIYNKMPGEIRDRAMDEHLNLIHKARINLLATALPPGDIVLDLGGANCPLYKMGYPHKFKKLYLIDLAPEDRHDMYKEIIVDPNAEEGEVVIKYGDMTELDAFDDSSVDFVWAGQSIEHVSVDSGRKMCRAAYRVLKPGGAFCLDTPNRLITKIHTREIGGGFIHPEHCIEYEPDQLRKILEAAGFAVKVVLGVCEMPNTSASGVFDYTDFLFGKQISENVDQSYIQYFHCVKNH